MSNFDEDIFDFPLRLVIACNKREAFAQGSKATEQSISQQAANGLLRSARNDGFRLLSQAYFFA